MKKFIKYLINFAGLIYIIFYAYVSYAMIVRVPNIERLMAIIRIQVERFTLISIGFIVIITFINYVFERKFEKRKTSYEFIWLSLIHFLILILAITYFSNDFYKEYMKSPQYF
ncbi:putative membrane protein [Flavobacterium sp. CG_9.10]|nr:putative membrane protein [Flavobacterium sp. CG_9.10]